MWIEATEPSKAPGELQIELAFLEGKDTVRGTATWGDLDIDSDNNNGLDARPIWTPTDAEDAIEDDPDKPGKFLAVTDGDRDNDGIPEFADANHEGYLYHFTPLVLELPKFLDWDHATIRFDYSASDPFDVRTDQGTPDDLYVYRPAPGHLRLWKLDENGNYSYIESQIAYTASVLGFGPDNQIVNLFVEGVRESASSGDQRITVEIDSNSTDGVPGVIGDTVRVTVVRVDLDIDSDNTNGFNADWGRSGYDYEDHIEDIREDANQPGKLIAANMGDIDRRY